MSLYKFTHKPLIKKNDAQLKQKRGKKKITQNLLKKKNHAQKKVKKKKKNPSKSSTYEEG